MNKFARILSGVLVPFGAVMVFGLPVHVQAQAVYHVRPGATGSNNGSDWNNAYTSLPGTLVRGSTYYLADGAYGHYQAKTPASGTSRITLKKATQAEHGSAAGWSNLYGDGQATFSQIQFQTSDWTIDGATGGGPGSWKTGFGIAVQNKDNCIHAVAYQVNNITLRHMDMSGYGNDGGGDGYPPNDIIFCWPYPQPFNTNWQLEYLFMHDATAMFDMKGLNNSTIQYCYSARNESVPAEHSIAVWFQGANNVVRHCVWEDIEGTGVIMLWGDGFDVYDNLIFNSGTPGMGDSGTGNAAIGGWSHAHTFTRNARVYNNTIVRGTGFNNGIAFHSPAVSGNVARNNLFVGNVSVYFLGVQTLDNNTIDNNTSRFVNWAGNDFRLNTSLVGAPIASTYNTDLMGVTRGGDGVWDRGAYEFRSGPDTVAPVISSVQVSGITTNGAVINWTTDEPSSSLVVYGPTTAYGSSVTNGTLVTSHSMAINGQPGSIYHFRVSSADSSGNQVQGSDATFATLILDLAAPTVTLTAPLGGTTISNSVTLSANAQDNVAVSDVEFRINNVLVNTDTSSPYSFSWNTRTVTNGSHAISAVARDAVGNRATNRITVTISNPIASLMDRLVGFWPLNETTGSTAQDVSGNGITGTLPNGGTWGAGRMAGGLNLDGANDYLRIPSAPRLESTVTGLTVCAWVNVQPNGQWQAVARKVLQDGVHEFPYSAYDLIVEDAGTLLPRMAVSREDGTRGLVYGSTRLSYGEWNHLAGVYDGEELMIYVNGVLEGSAPFTGDIAVTGQPLLIGRNGTGGDSLKGGLDDVRIYDRALTTLELQDLVVPRVLGAPTIDVSRSQLNVQPGVSYRLAYKDPLAAGGWSRMPALLANANSIVLTNISVPGRQKAYRVEAGP